MAGAKINLSVFGLILTLSCVLCSKLNVPRVLLPIFGDFSTKFTLEAIDGGCYKWSTTRSDIIKLTLIEEQDPSCSHKVEVSTITKEATRNLAVVLAEDVNTEQILKCDVIVDVIDSLSITTTTRELFMEEVPEVFQINAYDNQGNEFSTLEDVEFDWSIISVGPHKEATVLRYLPFKDSPYETPVHVRGLEEHNKKGYMVLLEGIKTGCARVSVKLPYAEYRHVMTVDVVLTIIANLLLTPVETYVMVGDVIHFKLFYMHNGKMEHVPLPDVQYYLESEDTDKVICTPNTNEATAVKLGRTRVLLHDNHIDHDNEDPALKLPSVTINVVQPGYIVLSILPHKNWAVLVGDQHEILAEVFDTSDHRMHLGPGVEIHIQVGDGFHVEERSKNGSWMAGWGVKESRTLVQATLQNVIHPSRGKFPLANVLTSQAELYIYPRISIIPPEVILPWNPQVKPKYDVDLIPKGGDGRFLWSSSDNTIGVVSQTGHVRTLTHGQFDVSAAMMRNHHNRQIVKFMILPPVKLEIAEFVMEAEIGMPIHLHVAMYAEKTDKDNTTRSFVPFTQCQNLPFQIRQSDNKFEHNKSAILPPVGITCGNIAMVGTAVGTSKITIAYYEEGLILEDSVTISAYNPLQLLNPEFDVVLAVGSSINLVYTGGPRPQIGRQSEHQRIVIIENEDIALGADTTDDHSLPVEDNTVVHVLCKRLGETSVKLMVSNTPSVPNCKSRGSTLVTKIICGKPRMVHLQPELQVNDAKSCPMDLSSDRVVVPTKQDIHLDVIVQDELGRSFLNISTFLFDWQAEPSNKIQFKIKDGAIMKVNMLGTVMLTGKSQQIVKTTPDMGLIEVSTTLVSYKKDLLKLNKIVPEFPEFLTGEERVAGIPKITSTIGLYLVEDTTASPNFTVIFNQPNKKKSISVLHGSGYVELLLSSDDIAEVKYLEGTREIEITPLTSGDLTIQIVDLCLIANPVNIYVKVVSLGKIEVVMVDKVEINHCIEVVVQLYDESEQPLNVTDMGHVDLPYKFTSNIANLGRMPRSEDDTWPMGEVHYVLTGIELGTTQLTFTFDNNGQEIISNPAELQVFPPLSLSPRNGTMLMGSRLQLSLKGGPQPATSIEFTSFATETAEVSEIGIVVAKQLGATRITARSVGIHPRTGDKVIFAEDSADLQVMQITGIKIMAPLTKFRVGGTVPVWVTGIPEQLSPLILASLEDASIDYHWYLQDLDVATLIGVFSSVGVLYKNHDKVINRVTGLQPGKTRLNLNVTLLNTALKNRPAIMFHTGLDLEVFEPLSVSSPPGIISRSVLLAQHCSIQLQTNLDGMSEITYGILQQNNDATEVAVASSDASQTDGIITVTETGFLRSFGKFGHSMLQVSATDADGLRQTLTFVVEVKAVHYMMLTVVANWRIHLDSSLRVLPLGTNFDLVANFYDEIGNKFNAGPQDLKVRSNRLDLVKVRQFPNNASIRVGTKKPGHTVMKVWTEGSDNLADYVRLHAEEVIKPIMEYLTSGDIMCLWSPVVTRHLQGGQWTSSDETLIVIDAGIDLAFVVGYNEGTVLLTHTLHPNAPLRLRVLPIAEVDLSYNWKHPVTNVPEGAIFRAPVVLKNRLDPVDKKINLIQGWHCDKSFVTKYTAPTPFRCYIAFSNHSITLDANEIFELKSSLDPRIGQYNCKLTTNGNNASEVSTFQTNLTIWVISDEGEVESQILEVPFIPGVYAQPEVYIKEFGTYGELEVTGLPEVLKQIIAVPADSSVIYVDKGYMLTPNKRKFQVKVIDYHPKFSGFEETMGIVIHSPITDQEFKVLVRVSNKYYDDSCLGNSPLFKMLVEHKSAFYAFIGTLIVLLISFIGYTRWLQPVVNVNVHPSRSLLQTGVLDRNSMYMSSMANRSGVYGPGMRGPSRTAVLAANRPMSQSPEVCPSCSPNNCSCASRSGRADLAYGNVSNYSLDSPEFRRNRSRLF